MTFSKLIYCNRHGDICIITLEEVDVNESIYITDWSTSQLYTVDYSENLPDTLDIGDVAESGSSSYKLKNLSKGEVGGTSSGGTQPLSS